MRCPADCQQADDYYLLRFKILFQAISESVASCERDSCDTLLIAQQADGQDSGQEIRKMHM